MHNAPSVVYPVGRCAFQAWLLLGLGLFNAALGTFFLLTSDFSTARVPDVVPGMVAFLAWMAWTVWAVLSWWRSPEGVLRWDSVSGDFDAEESAWSWRARDGLEQVPLSEVERVLDLQDRVLLRCRSAGARQRWIWVERRRLPARWSDLRRALVSRAS